MFVSVSCLRFLQRWVEAHLRGLWCTARGDERVIPIPIPTGPVSWATESQIPTAASHINTMACGLRQSAFSCLFVIRNLLQALVNDLQKTKIAELVRQTTDTDVCKLHEYFDMFLTVVACNQVEIFSVSVFFLFNDILDACY